MANELSQLRAPKGATKSKRRLGRGPGSGHGKTSGRGHKGAGQHAGSGAPAGFEGGQMPLQRRLPKVGFVNIFRKEYSVINLKDLSSRFQQEEEISPEKMIEKGLLKRNHKPVKILGEGEISFPLTVKAHRFSASAKSKIEAAGGKAILL